MSRASYPDATVRPLGLLLRRAGGPRTIRRIRDAISRRLAAFEAELANRLSPDGHVIGGPFAGMAYRVRNLGTSVTLPKLLGSYEEELHAELEAILQRSYSDVVDIGCGEGYYAIGLALRLPGARIHAFDLDPLAVKATRDLAVLNGVSERVFVLEGCSSDQLRSIEVSSRALIVSDCEGAELELIAPTFLPATANKIDLLVECHEFGADTSISDALRERFASSHRSKVITSRDRIPSNYPLLRGWTSGELEMALSESRPPEMRWLSLIQEEQPTESA